MLLHLSSYSPWSAGKVTYPQTCSNIAAQTPLLLAGPTASSYPRRSSCDRYKQHMSPLRECAALSPHSKKFLAVLDGSRAFLCEFAYSPHPHNATVYIIRPNEWGVSIGVNVECVCVYIYVLCEGLATCLGCIFCLLPYEHWDSFQ